MFLRIAALAALLVCCRGVSPAAVSGGVWLDVPFVKQEKDRCGAAAIAMVMQYWLLRQGRPLSESSDATLIGRALYVQGARGIYASSVERYFQQHGFHTFSFRGEWGDLQQNLQKGRPLIVALKPSGGGSPIHYVVVAGLDQVQGLVMLNDPARRKLLKQNRSAFEKQWTAAANWTLLALPEG